MFFTKIRRLRSTLALRLTSWYATIFGLSSALAFALVYVLTVSAVLQHTDDEMRQDIGEFATLFMQEGIERVKSEIVLDTHS